MIIVTKVRVLVCASVGYVGLVCGCSSEVLTPLDGGSVEAGSSDASSADAVSGDGALTDAGGPRTWMGHPCGNGDPVGCSFTNPVDIPDPTFPSCSSVAASAGSACTNADDRCVLIPARKEGGDASAGCRSSATYLHCRSEPFPTPAACPVSSRTKKTDIHYLAGVERERVAQEVLALRLASYRYTDDPEMGTTTGFILEDSPTASFVMTSRGRVNEHSYVSALVATVQTQQTAIHTLEKRLGELERTCASRSKGSR